MSIDGFEPLNEEERLLAAKLGMGKRSYAPSPAVDDAIRATAQKELARTTTRKPPATAWWKVGAVAAACVLAIGIAWKTLHAPSAGELEAMQTAEPVNDSPAVPAPSYGAAAESAAIPVAETEGDAVSENAPVQSEEAAPATAAATPPAPPAPRTMADAPASVTPDRPAPAAHADNSEPAIAADTESAGARLKQRAPLPPAPPEEVNAAQRANDAALETPSPAPVPVTSSATRAAVYASPEAAAATPAPAERKAAGALENGYDPRPPKTTEAEDVQLAWLKRIRTLYQSGKKEEAAASLEAWRKRYPDAPVPADLAPLGKVTPEK